MATTFIDRIRVLPTVGGQPRALLISDNGALNQHENISKGIKRQVPPPSTLYNGYLKCASHYMSAPDAKRRRQIDELNYTASTIQQALEKAGRPPISLSTRVRALPSTVNTDRCTVITSAEYDASTQVAEQQPIKADINDAHDAHDAQGAKEDGADDIMCAYAELTQATRQFYGSVDIQAPVTPNETTGSIRKEEEEDEDEEEELRGSSQASTWAPTPPSRSQVMNDIDNDNRSDGASSNPQTSEEELSDVSSSDHLPSPFPPVHICG